MTVFLSLERSVSNTSHSRSTASVLTQREWHGTTTNELVDVSVNGEVLMCLICQHPLSLGQCRLALVQST